MKMKETVLKSRVPYYAEIDEERDRQDSKFGKDRNHSPQEWLMILGEEVGEANKHALEAHWQYGNMLTSLMKYRTELIQVAAVAIAMAESLDRQFTLPPHKHPVYNGMGVQTSVVDCQDNTCPGFTSVEAVDHE